MKAGSVEKSILNVGLEMLQSGDVEMIKKLNPALVDSLEYLKFDTKCNFKFSECFVISGNDDWNTKVEMCFEKLVEKMRDLHFTSTVGIGGKDLALSYPNFSMPLLNPSATIVQ